MGGKNKGGKNAFFYFMMDFKAKQGRSFSNMQELTAAADPHWRRMSPEQKKQYEIQAKSDKQNSQGLRFTSYGINIDVAERQENERKLKEINVRKDIERCVKVSLESGRLEEQLYYIFHVNIFCYCKSTRRYYPAEIAVARFNLRNGVSPDDIYHAIVKPGSLPLGYSYQAKDNSDKTHQLPPPLGDDNEDNLSEVVNGLVKFMTEIDDDYKMPPIYCVSQYSELIQSVLQGFCIDFGHPENLFKIYPLEHLFLELRNSISDTRVWPTVSLACAELEKDVYDYCRGIACPFHEVSDVPNHCSRSYVVRTVYIICDNCCGDLGIELIRGQHVPVNAKISPLMSRAGSQMSVVSSFSQLSQQSQAPSQHITRGNVFERPVSPLSIVSTSTAYDAHDFRALGGYDSEFSRDGGNEDGWVQPKQKHNRPKHTSQMPQASANPSPSMSFAGAVNTSKEPVDGAIFRASRPGSSVSNQPIRKPVTMSAGLTQNFAEMSLSTSNWPAIGAPISPHIGRGRGRGIAANLRNKMA